MKLNMTAFDYSNSLDRADKLYVDEPRIRHNAPCRGRNILTFNLS